MPERTKKQLQKSQLQYWNFSPFKFEKLQYIHIRHYMCIQRNILHELY